MDQKKALENQIKKSDKIHLVQPEDANQENLWGPESEAYIDALIVAPSDSTSRIESINKIKNIIKKYPTLSARLTPLERLKQPKNEDFIIEIEIYRESSQSA